MPIRRAKESDLLHLSQLIARSVHALNAGEDSPADLAYICSRHDEQNLRRDLQRREMFVLEVEGQVIGTTSLGDDKLHSLYVEPSCARRGYGHALVTHIEIMARNNSLSLLKVSSSRTAVPFYEKLSFRKLNFEPCEFASTWAMEKTL